MTANAKQPFFQTRRFVGSKARRFLLHFLELQLAMGLGALACYLAIQWISDSPGFATVYRPGTLLFAVGDIFFLTVPVVAWMAYRGHGLWHSTAMAIAMIFPVALLIVLGQLMAYDYLTWLLIAGYPVMSLGMLVYMLYRRDHFIQLAYSKHSAVPSNSSIHTN